MNQQESFRKGLTAVYFLCKIYLKIKSARKKMTTAEPQTPKRTRAQLERSLSAREREILNLLARGLSNKEIGAKLELSPFTVRNHLAHVFGKLRVRCRTEAVVAYLQAEDKFERLITH